MPVFVVSPFHGFVCRHLRETWELANSVKITINVCFCGRLVAPRMCWILTANRSLKSCFLEIQATCQRIFDDSLWCSNYSAFDECSKFSLETSPYDIFWNTPHKQCCCMCLGGYKNWPKRQQCETQSPSIHSSSNAVVTMSQSRKQESMSRGYKRWKACE